MIRYSGWKCNEISAFVEEGRSWRKCNEISTLGRSWRKCNEIWAFVETLPPRTPTLPPRTPGSVMRFPIAFHFLHAQHTHTHKNRHTHTLTHSHTHTHTHTHRSLDPEIFNDLVCVLYEERCTVPIVLVLSLSSTRHEGKYV